MTGRPDSRMRAVAARAAANLEARLAPAVAVLIMVISVAAALFAYLDSQAGNRAAAANRRAEAAGVEVLREAGVGEREIGQELIVYGYGNDYGWIAQGLREAASSDPLIPALADAFGATHSYATLFSDLVGSEYQLPDGFFEWARFVEESRRAGYRAIELQKAHSDVAVAWGAKSAKYVTIITVLAAALFLLGLTVSVVRHSQLTLVVTGVGLALVASLWGTSVALSSVPPVSERAIDAYLDGLIRVLVSSDPDDLTFAERRFGDAIEASPEYRDAYIGRAHARFQLDLADPNGPQGSPEAVEDLEVVLALDAGDAIVWNNLGAAWFWLDRYEDSKGAWLRALEFDIDEPILNINLAFVYLILDDPAYEAQLETLHGIIVGLPSWQRTSVVGGALSLLQLAETYRPEISIAADAFHTTLYEMDREIAVGRRFFGSPLPADVAATIGPPEFTLSEDGTTLRVGFAYTGLEEGQRFIYRTFFDGVESDAHSLFSAAPWTLAVPDGTAFVDIPEPDGFRGHTVRVEFYLEGNLLAYGEFSS